MINLFPKSTFADLIDNISLANAYQPSWAEKLNEVANEQTFNQVLKAFESMIHHRYPTKSGLTYRLHVYKSLFADEVMPQLTDVVPATYLSCRITEMLEANLKILDTFPEFFKNSKFRWYSG